MLLQSDRIILRALEPEDLDFLFSVENNSSFWEVSNTQTPFSRHILEQYLKNSQLDIYEAKQLRLIIELKSTQERIGFIDMFEFNPQHQRAGIGILILQKYQNHGFGSDVLHTFLNYTFKHLNLHQIYANIPADNIKSIQLFEKLKFKNTGKQKDWIFSNGSFKDVLIYQIINPNEK